MPEGTTERPVVIFLSYRRGDTQWAARGIYDRLVDKYGRGNVFRDLDAIPAGARFRDHIEEKIAESDIFILLIGTAWASYADTAGRRRLELPRDPVRLEVETALRLGVPIIPVRVEGAPMPTEADLVPSIVELLEYNAAEVSDSRWDFDLERLLQAIDEAVQRRSQPPRPRPADEPDSPTTPSTTLQVRQPPDQTPPAPPPDANTEVWTFPGATDVPSLGGVLDGKTSRHDTMSCPTIAARPVAATPVVGTLRDAAEEHRSDAERQHRRNEEEADRRGAPRPTTVQGPNPVARAPSGGENQLANPRGQRAGSSRLRRRGVALAAAAGLGSVALLIAYLVSVRPMDAQIMGHLPANLRASCSATGNESATCSLTDGTVVFFRLFNTSAEAEVNGVGRNEMTADDGSCPPSAPPVGTSVTCRYTLGASTGVAAFSHTAKGSVRFYLCRWIADTDPLLRGEMSTENATPQDWATLQANWSQLAGTS